MKIANKLLFTVALLVAMFAASASQAAINVFTEHRVVSMFQHGVNKYQDVQFPTGDYPYIGQLGLEYSRKNLSYSISYIHRSNVDISGRDEYNYNGISLGIKYRHCLAGC